MAWAGVTAGAVLSAPLSGHPGVVLVRTLPVLLAALGWGALRRLPPEPAGAASRRW